MAFTEYLSEIRKNLSARNATEHTHRPALKDLIESLAKGIIATNEPKREECGAPDYVVARRTKHGPLTIGYIEAKDIGQPLSKIQKSEQLKRYLKALPNLILTDYLEFHWYVLGEKRLSGRLARVDSKGKIKPDQAGAEQVAELLQGFLSQKPLDINKPKELAQRLAFLTHMIRDIIIEAFAKNKASHMITDLRKAFAEQLIPDLDQPEHTAEFADMFAQTLAYGLFAARINHNKPTPFKRLGAAAEIPKTNPFLRRLFETITGTALDEEPFAGFVDDLVQLLAHTDIEAILENFGKRTKKEDPIVHFYETFLAAYDPKLRESRGVYYTPEPVVSYIVRSVDHLLKTRFKCPAGLADTAQVEYEESVNGKKRKQKAPKVLILDPACGTGTFLYAVIDQIRDQFMRRHNAGMWSGFVRKQLLRRLFGFELLMAPYAVAHLKLGLQLAGQDLPAASRKQWAYDFGGDERLGIYLTNTLEEAERRAQLEFGFLRTLAEEANGASSIKKNLPIMVVMGNPPYSGLSANMNEWIDRLLKNRLPLNNGAQSYYEIDGQPLGEKKVWLQDDYVKFIRFAQYRIEQTGHGILAFISNNGYLDNPTFRGMRQSLMQTFDQIYVLDLHGSTKKKEVCPDGSKDENVFDIQQGVGIGIFVRNPKCSRTSKVHHAELWGNRKSKYSWLFDYELASTKWSSIKPTSPYYFLIPRDASTGKEYQQFQPIGQVFPINVTGIVTARDHFVIEFTDKELLDRMADFRARDATDDEIRNKYFPRKGSAKYPSGDTRSWKLPRAREQVSSDKEWDKRARPILYRPFDSRSIYYTPWMVDWPRPEVMRHMLAGENLGLITTRQTRDRWDALITRNIVGHKSVAAYDINSIFPLYLYPDPKAPAGRTDEHWPVGKNGRRPNLSPDFVNEFAAKLGLKFVSDGRGDLKKTFGPENVFAYTYAVFHSPTYRARYAEFLKIDFPRLPLTANRELFARLCELGQELLSLHLLEKTAPGQPSYPVSGENAVEKVRYVEPSNKSKGQVWINKTQYFDGVAAEVWQFHIGGYQVANKWLKDRKGRKLSFEDLSHYRQVVAALGQTIRLMEEIDRAIPKWPIE